MLWRWLYFVFIVVRVLGLRSNGWLDDVVLENFMLMGLCFFVFMENVVRELNCLKSFLWLIFWKENFGKEIISFGGNFLKLIVLDL